MGWNCKFFIVSTNFAVANLVFLLQLCRGQYTDDVTVLKVKLRTSSQMEFVFSTHSLLHQEKQSYNLFHCQLTVGMKYSLIFFNISFRCEYQVLKLTCKCLQVIKREPGSLGSRCWSLYGKLYLRHFNELDHELNARLNRAYRPASKYMNIFTSPLMTIIAQ